jgi:hypothetical protein
MKRTPLSLAGVRVLSLVAIIVIGLLAPSFGQTFRGRGRFGGRGGIGPAPTDGPTANAGADRSAFVNETLSLDGTATIDAFDGLQPDGRHSIQWDFGYGGWTYEGGLTAPIAYPEAGTYIVTLTVYNALGASSSDTTTITISAITLGSEETLTDTGNSATNRNNLQAAIDNSTGTNNKVITIPALFPSRGTIALKHRTVANYCTIRTANHASLPNGTSRVGPADASNMVILEVTGSANIIETPATSSNPARYYNFVGIHFRKATATTSYTHTMVSIGQGDETSVDQLPNHFIFDRCYWDGGSTTSNTLRGVMVRGTDISIVNSYIHRFKGVAIESQGVCWLYGERLAALNNFIEGASENFLLGGGDHNITGLTVHQSVVRRNHMKKDVGWRFGDLAYYGTDMSVKNIFEIKWCDGLSVQGNRFEAHWMEDQNYSVTVTVRNQGDSIPNDGTGSPWAIVRYLDFSYNQVNKFGNGMSIAAEDDLQSAQATNRVLVRHNVFSGASFYNGQHIIWLLGGGQTAPIQGFDRVYIVHNSADNNGSGGQGRSIEWGPSTLNTNFVFSGNIVQGFINHDSGVTGLAAFQAACSGTSFSATKNGFYKPTGTNPVDNTTVSLIADVKYANLAAFDLSLQGDSPFLTTGLAGARAGADVAAVNTLCANVVSGAW